MGLNHSGGKRDTSQSNDERRRAYFGYRRTENCQNNVYIMSVSLGLKHYGSNTMALVLQQKELIPIENVKM